MSWTPITSDAELAARIVFGQTPEGHHLEFKARRPEKEEGKGIDNHLSEFARDVAQFSNTDGGSIIYGVSEGRNAEGLRVASGISPLADVDGDIQWMNQALQQRLFPALRVDIQSRLLDGRPVIVINVPPHEKAVFVWDGDSMQFFQRYNNRKVSRTPDEMEMHLMDGSRAKKLAFERVRAEVKGQATVQLASGYWTWDTNRQVAVRREGIKVFLFAANEHRLDLKMSVENGRHVYVPYSLIEDVWDAGSGELGLLLKVKIVFLGGELRLMS